MNRIALIGLACAIAGCGSVKEDATDDFSNLAALDEKSDQFLGVITSVGNFQCIPNGALC